MTKSYQKPVRIQLKRTKGFNLQAASIALNGLAAVRVDRATKWGNPFNWKTGSPDAGPADWRKGVAVDLFREWWRTGRGPTAPTDADLDALRGKNLACWCKPGSDPCHADVLLELAASPLTKALP